MSDTELNESAVVAQTELIPEVTQPTLGPGAQLAVHRQTRGWTVEQVADQLNLAPRQIQALEIDNYAALPGIVFARGFIRTYAKLLKVDPTPFVAMMPGETVQMEPVQLKHTLSVSLSASRLPSMGRNGLLSKSVIVAALLVLILVGALAAHWSGLLPDFSNSVSEKIEKGVTLFSPSSSSITSPIGENVASDNAPLHAPMVNSTTADSSGLPAQGSVASDVTVITNSASTVPLMLSSPVVTTIVPVVPDEVGIPNNNVLVVKVHEDSWVEVKGANNSVLIWRLLKAGTTEVLTITQPISLTVGNVSGVDVTLRGNPVDLKSTAKNNIARLNLK